jgi:hypothetical protein
MQIDAIGIRSDPVILHDRRRVHADMAKSKRRAVSLAAIVIHEAPDHKNIVAGTNFGSPDNILGYQHLRVQDGDGMLIGVHIYR